MKKVLSCLLVCVLLWSMAAPAAAASVPADPGVISLRLHSDVAGCTDADYEKLIEILSPQVTYYVSEHNGPVSIANAAGGPEYAHMDAGRYYCLDYMLVAAEGYALPEELGKDDVQIECGKGVRLLSCDVVQLAVPHAEPGSTERIPVLRVRATVVTDGTVLQRIIGWFLDVLLRIRSWQLY